VAEEEAVLVISHDMITKTTSVDVMELGEDICPCACHLSEDDDAVYTECEYCGLG